jgi:(2Fe-2S) ferredoxin
MNPDRWMHQSPFQIEGEFLGFLGEPGGKIKFLRIMADQQEFQIKLSDELRHPLSRELVLGDRIQVLGERKLKGGFNELKLKAYQINRLSANSQPDRANLPASPSPQLGKILLCQKSGCLKRGGYRLKQALEQALDSLGLRDRVTIESTSCQKCCKQAPNFIVMPGQYRYSGSYLSPEAIRSLLERHYGTELEANR